MFTLGAETNWIIITLQRPREINTQLSTKLKGFTDSALNMVQQLLIEKRCMRAGIELHFKSNTCL